MERTLLLLALSSLLVCSLAQLERPHKVLGNGKVTCASAPIPGVTLTALCRDGKNPPRRMTAVSDEDGLFSFDYFTDIPPTPGTSNIDGVLDVTTAECTLLNIQPAVVTKEMICNQIKTSGQCSFTTASRPLTPEMSVDYAAQQGCILEQPPPAVQAAIPFTPCSLTNRQVFPKDSVIFTVSDRTLPISSKFPVTTIKDEDTCGWACMETPGCAHYSFNCMACALYKKNAIATTPAQLVTENYEVLRGTWVCPENYVGTCR